MSIYHRACFLSGAHKLSQCPPDSGYEVAFAGRSNAGKSSAINAITHQTGLARTSKTPGRTQQINFFSVDEERRLVDLPGYGYAEVPLSVKQHWQHTLEQYLYHRESLQGLILLMDIRHPLTDFDQAMLEWCQNGGMAVHILLTKADKLSYGNASSILQQVKNKIGHDNNLVSVQLFSALKKTGVSEVCRKLDQWLMLKSA